jgi:hypothetical protein
MYMEELGCYMTKNNLIKYLMPVGVLLAFSSMANAIIVAPGGSGAPTGEVATFPGGVMVADTGIQPAVGVGGNLKLHYEEQVWTDPGNVFCAGCLDFVITASVDAGSNDPMGSITAASFKGAQTDIDYILGTGPTNPTNVSRSGDGTTTGWDFGAGVTPGNHTATLIVQTNARTFQAGVITFQNEDVSRNPAFGIAPEPNMAALLSVFAVGIIGLAYRRKKNVAKNTEV